MRTLLALVLLVGCSSAAPVPKALKQPKAPPLVGLWKPVGTSRTYYDFQPDGTMRCWTEGNERSASSYTWTVDAGSSPGRMTWVNAGKRWEAVYELNGDSLKFFYAHASVKLPDTVGPHPDGNFEQLTRTPAAK